MKKHTKIYCDYFNIGEQDFPLCEICGTKKITDIHHISPRGMGGSKNKDYIENLMGLCRNCHNDAERKQITQEECRDIHLEFVNNKSEFLDRFNA